MIYVCKSLCKSRNIYKGWKIFHLHAVITFLNGDITQDFYIEQPKGYGMLGKEKIVCKFFKALYGLKQAPRVCYSKRNSILCYDC